MLHNTLKKSPDGRVYQNEKNLQAVSNALDNISPSLCLAKFTQVTMHLETGLVHSCHHPQEHKIPLNEIEDNPAALFNTTILKHARSQMLNGERPKECDYCWRVEDNNSTERSDRYLKSSEDWAVKHYDEIIASNGDETFKPTYLEVSFGNACNLKCAYCGPEFSSKWIDDIRRNGPLKVTDGKGSEQWVQGWQDLNSLTIPNREENPYIEAFWKWFPEIYPTLKHFRVTGGEPLLNKNTLKSLDYILENPSDHLEFSINTNLSVPEKVWNDFIERIQTLESNAQFKKITVFTSVEGFEERAEYARTGLDFELLRSRVVELLEKTSVRCVFMATYNMFAITSFQRLLEWILELKRAYNFNDYRNNVYQQTGYDVRINKSVKSDVPFRVGIDIPYLRHPPWLDVQYCSETLLMNYMIPCLDFLTRNIGENDLNMHLGFEPYEVEKFSRIVHNRIHYDNYYKDGKHDFSIMQNRAKFYDFVNSLDNRNQTNFLCTFPEMEEFYNSCLESHDIYNK